MKQLEVFHFELLSGVVPIFERRKLTEQSNVAISKRESSDTMDSWSKRKVVFIHNTTKYVFLHYREFLEKFVAAGAEVVVIAPFDDSVNKIRGMGVRCIDIVMSRQGLNPVTEVTTLIDVYRLIAKEKPHVVFNYSIKPVIYGSIAARWNGVQNIYSMITGLGHLFMDQTIKYKMIRSVILPLYRMAIGSNSAVFFQNPDDKELFIDCGLIDEGKGFVINGTGIDLEGFAPGQKRSVGTKFILVSRLLWSKGIKEYVDAARLLKRQYPDTEFEILGMYDDNPTSIQKQEIETWQDEGVINYLGASEDVRPYLREASVFVLPTIYREGRPRAVVEAMATGKPVITTDTPGCRQTVVHGQNGFLVPVKNVQALAEAMEKFILNPDLVEKMGNCSRELAEEQYNVNEINDAITSIMSQRVGEKYNW